MQKHALASACSRTATRKGAERTRHGSRAAALTSPAEAAANHDASGTRGGERSFSKTAAADSGAVHGPSGMFAATVSPWSLRPCPLQAKTLLRPQYERIGLVSSRRTNVCVGRLRELRATRDWAGCMELEAEACSVTVQASEPATAAEIYNTLGNGLEVMKEKRRATL